MLVLAIIFAIWLAVVVAVVILCRGTQQLDQEIEQRAGRRELASLRLPFAS